MKEEKDLPFVVEIMTKQGPLAGQWQYMQRFSNHLDASNFIEDQKKIDAKPPIGHYKYRIRDMDYKIQPLMAMAFLAGLAIQPEEKTQQMPRMSGPRKAITFDERQKRNPNRIRPQNHPNRER